MWSWLKGSDIAEDHEAESLKKRLDIQIEYTQKARKEWEERSRDWESRLLKPSNPYRIRRNPETRSFVVEEWIMVPPGRAFTTFPHMRYMYSFGLSFMYKMQLIEEEGEERVWKTLQVEGRIEWHKMHDGFPYEADAVQWLRQYLNADEISEYDSDAKRQAPVGV